MTTDWALALLPWLIGLPLLFVFMVWAWWSRSRARDELLETVRHRFRAQVSGNAQQPWKDFHVLAEDLQVTAPGSITTGFLQSGSIRVDALASLPDLMVMPEPSRVMLFGVNGTRPILTGTASFDEQWRVMPVANETSAAVPPRAYVSWARPDVVAALRLLDLSMLEVASGRLALALPPVNVLGVHLATRVVRTITALSRGQSPPMLALPGEPVSANVANGSLEKMAVAGVLASLLLFLGPSVLFVGHLIPGSDAIACPAGGSYENYCPYSSCSSSVRAPHRYQTGCVVRGPSGLKVTTPDPTVIYFESAWMLGGVAASPLVLLGMFGAIGRNSARATRRLLERGSRGE